MCKSKFPTDPIRVAAKIILNRITKRKIDLTEYDDDGDEGNKINQRNTNKYRDAAPQARADYIIEERQTRQDRWGGVVGWPAVNNKNK